MESREDVPEDEDSLELQTRQLIRDNYGVWINLMTEDFSEEDFENMTEADQEQILFEMMLSQVAKSLRDSLIQQNDTNMATLASLGDMMGRVESDDFESQSGLYRLKEAAALEYFTSLGFVDQHIEAGRAPGNFLVSYLDPAQPSIYESVSAYSSRGSDDSGSEFISLSSNLTFFNVNNTVISFDSGKASGARDFFAPILKKAIEDMTGGNE